MFPPQTRWRGRVQRCAPHQMQRLGHGDQNGKRQRRYLVRRISAAGHRQQYLQKMAGKSNRKHHMQSWGSISGETRSKGGQNQNISVKALPRAQMPLSTTSNCSRLKHLYFLTRACNPVFERATEGAEEAMFKHCTSSTEEKVRRCKFHVYLKYRCRPSTLYLRKTKKNSATPLLVRVPRS